MSIRRFVQIVAFLSGACLRVRIATREQHRLRLRPNWQQRPPARRDHTGLPKQADRDTGTLGPLDPDRHCTGFGP